MLGRVLAVRLSKMGKKVVIFEAPDRFGLSADTLRNHAWLQSGLLYGDDATWVSAQRMLTSGEMLFELAGLPRPVTRGVFRLRQGQEDALRGKADRLNIEIGELREQDAREVLGSFFQPDFKHYWVPDTLFDEPAILAYLAYGAKLHGADFRKARIRLVEDTTARNKFALAHEGGIVESEFTILCAGAGSGPLLEGLGLEHPLQTYQSPLLVLRCGVVLQTPLLVDRSEGPPTPGLAVGQHGPTRSDAGRCVIGNRVREKILSCDLLGPRVVPDAHVEGLLALVPEELRPLSEAAPESFRITAGYKTEALQEDGRPSINPWVQSWPEQYPGLIAAVPGKATLSFVTASRILGELGLLNGQDSPVEQEHKQRQGEGDEEIRMHHAHSYDGVLHEVEKKPDRA